MLQSRWVSAAHTLILCRRAHCDTHKHTHTHVHANMQIAGCGGSAGCGSQSHGWMCLCGGRVESGDNDWLRVYTGHAHAQPQTMGCDFKQLAHAHNKPAPGQQPQEEDWKTLDRISLGASAAARARPLPYTRPRVCTLRPPWAPAPHTRRHLPVHMLDAQGGRAGRGLGRRPSQNNSGQGTRWLRPISGPPSLGSSSAGQALQG